VEPPVELPSKLDSNFQLYKNDTFVLRATETHQLGFRFAKELNLSGLSAVDYIGSDFPFDSLVAAAVEAKQFALIEKIKTSIDGGKRVVSCVAFCVEYQPRQAIAASCQYPQRVNPHFKYTNMKKRISTLLLFSTCCSLLACNMATPENYFDRAVLSCNMMAGFANDQFHRELEQPSAKLKEGTKDQTEPMKRKEVIDNQIQFVEENYAKLKDLKETDDTKDILKTSVALYEYTLPVYKNEYTQLAKLYDDGAPAQQIETLTQSILDKYAAGFEERYNAVISAGKPFAARHHINVQWDIKTSPDLR